MGIGLVTLFLLVTALYCFLCYFNVFFTFMQVFFQIMGPIFGLQQGTGAIIYFLYTLFSIISPLFLHGNENILLILMQKIYGVSGLKYPHTAGARWVAWILE